VPGAELRIKINVLITRNEQRKENPGMSRLRPLTMDEVPEDLRKLFMETLRAGNFLPNSQLIMARKPKLVKAFRQLTAAVFDPEGEVSVGFKRLLAYVVARTHGCHY
jgi:hypothetical protein